MATAAGLTSSVATTESGAFAYPVQLFERCFKQPHDAFLTTIADS